MDSKYGARDGASLHRKLRRCVTIITLEIYEGNTTTPLNTHLKGNTRLVVQQTHAFQQIYASRRSCNITLISQVVRFERAHSDRKKEIGAQKEFRLEDGKYDAKAIDSTFARLKVLGNERQSILAESWIAVRPRSSFCWGFPGYPFPPDPSRITYGN